MNQRDRIMERSRIRNLIRLGNMHKNVLRWSSNETDAHIEMKFKICKYLRKQKIEFYTEAIFKTGLRADILNVDEGVVYEVVNSEKETSIQKKREYYPLPIIFINANQEFNELLIT